MPTPSHRGPLPARRPVLRVVVVAVSLLALGIGTPVIAQVVGPPGGTEPDPAQTTIARDLSDVSEQGPSEAPTSQAARKRSQPRLTVVKGQSIRKAPEPEPKPKPKPEADPEADADLREEAEDQAQTSATQPSGPMSFRVGSFNVLGSQHTAPGGGRQKFPPASTRTAGAANLVVKHDVDVLGAQELQADQLRGLQSRTGMAAFPGFAWGEAETDNSILWDPGVFELVSGSKFTLTFMSRPRPQPIVRLRHRATGREFFVVNTHPSAGGGQYLTQRRNGQATLVGVVNNLKAQGLPVIVTGDMNDREEFYCQVVPPTGMTASNGGSYGSGCQPPPSPLPVDWVVGSGLGWSNYWRDTTPVDNRTSDHFFISALANVG